MRAAVTEADNHNRYVTVHAYHPRAVNRALRAGVRCVEHGNLLDDESISLLLERDAYLVPTLVTFEQLHRFGKQAGLPGASYRKLAEVRDAGLASLEKAHQAGVNLVYGSDLLGPMHSDPRRRRVTRQRHLRTARRRGKPGSRDWYRTFVVVRS